MSGGRVDDALSFARDLERRDTDVAARLDVVVGTLKLVDGVRERAHALGAELDEIPLEIDRLEEAERDARAREAEARRELAEAERRHEEVSRSRRSGDEAKAAAERAVRSAAVAATDAAGSATRVQDALAALEVRKAAQRAEVDGLAVVAADVAEGVSAVPRVSESGRSLPGATLDEIDAWAARTHAALVVVRGGLESERERIVLEANALATAALGEHVWGSSVALVVRRIEKSDAGP